MSLSTGVGNSWQYRLYRDLLSNAEDKLETMDSTELAELDRKVIQEGLTCLRNKTFPRNLAFPTDEQVKQVFEKYVYGAIQTALDGLIQKREAAYTDPRYKSVEEFTVKPLKPETVQKIHAMNSDELSTKSSLVVMCMNARAEASRDLPLLREWKANPDQIFSDLLPLI